MEFKEKVALLFELTFSAKSTPEVLESQKSLSLLSTDPSFLRTLYEIISDPTKNLDTKPRLKAIKKAATLYLKKFIDESLENDENLKHDTLYFFSQIVCEGIYNENVSTGNKSQFLIILNKLMLNDLSKLSSFF